MEIVQATAIISGGLFAGTALTIAWDRLPVWKNMPFEIFKTDFKRTVLIADFLQPALLLISVISLFVLGLQSTGVGRVMSFVAIAGYMIILLASLIVLVPLQRKLFMSARDETSQRLRWLKGHVGRTVLSLASFGASAVAIAFT